MFRLKLIALAVMIAGASFFVWHYKSLLEENKRLTDGILAANKTIIMLDKKVEAENRIRKNTERLIDEVRNAPESQDAPVAPVLDNILDRL